MARFSVHNSCAVWDLGNLGELHRVGTHGGKCQLWTGDRSNPKQCDGQVAYVWAAAGRCDVCFCEAHGIETFPDARNKPDYEVRA